jgi:hypothetical protein
MPAGPETNAYMERVRQIALSTADPYALREAAAMAEIDGDKPKELALWVAHRAALARDRGVSYDPSTDEVAQAKAAALPENVAKQAIADGTQYVAMNYRSHK